MNLFSRSSEQTIRVAAYLALESGKDYCLVREMSKKLGIPSTVLVKLLQPLVTRRVVDSRRGRNGGFRLARPATEITLFEIVDAVDHLSGKRQCVLGQSECTDERACPLHEYWKKVYEQFRELVIKTTLDALVQFRKERPESGYPLL